MLHPSTFKEALKRIINQPFEMIFDGKEGRLTVNDAVLASLYSSVMILQNDFMCTFTLLIVPRFDETMENVFNHFDESGIFNVNAVLPKLLSSNVISINSLKVYIKSISSEILMSVKNYIEFGMSINLVAKAMYAHRNTINYRINKFCEKSGINVRKVVNAYFIYLIMTWDSKERIAV